MHCNYQELKQVDALTIKDLSLHQLALMSKQAAKHEGMMTSLKTLQQEMKDVKQAQQQKPVINKTINPRTGNAILQHVCSLNEDNNHETLFY